jgi:hypothetical protein
MFSIDDRQSVGNISKVNNFFRFFSWLTRLMKISADITNLLQFFIHLWTERIFFFHLQNSLL